MYFHERQFSRRYDSLVLEVKKSEDHPVGDIVQKLVTILYLLPNEYKMLL